MVARRVLRNLGDTPEKPQVDLTAKPRSAATLRPDRNFTGTVTVACKLPNGLILSTNTFVEATELTLNGPRTIRVSHRDTETFQVHGNRVPFGQMPGYPIVAGYAMTGNIPRAFWEKWLEQHKDMEIVRNRIIFAYPTAADATAAAKDHRTVRSGLEALDPEKPPKGLEKIKKFDKKAAPDADEAA